MRGNGFYGRSQQEEGEDIKFGTGYAVFGTGAVPNYFQCLCGFKGSSVL